MQSGYYYWSDLGAVHWLLVSMLAARGLSTGEVIRRDGSMSQAGLGGLAALLLVAPASQLAQQLEQPPPLLFYLTCCLAAAAIMQLRQNWAWRVSKQQQQQHDGAVATAAVGRKAAGSCQLPAQQKPGFNSTSSIRSFVLGSIGWLLGGGVVTSSSSSNSSGWGGAGGDTGESLQQGIIATASPGQAAGMAPCKAPGPALTGLGWVQQWAKGAGFRSELLCWTAGVLDRLLAAAVLLSVLLLLMGAIVPVSSSSRAHSTVHLHRGQRAAAAAGLPTTDAPMPPGLVSMPCVDGTWLQRERFCPVVNCSMAASCTVADPNCCAHLSLHMLAYLDWLLTSAGLGQHYVIVYGSLLGRWWRRQQQQQQGLLFKFSGAGTAVGWPTSHHRTCAGCS